MIAIVLVIVMVARRAGTESRERTDEAAARAPAVAVDPLPESTQAPAPPQPEEAVTEIVADERTMLEILQTTRYGRAREMHLLEQAAREDPSGTANWVATLDEEHAYDGLRRVLAVWIQSDLQGAGEWVAGMAEGPLRRQAILSISQLLLESAASAADIASWINLAADHSRTALLAPPLASLWSQIDAMAAFDWASGLPDGMAVSHSIAAIVATVAPRNPEAALEWIESFPEGDLRNNAFGIALRELAQHDPRQAADWLSRLPEPVLTGSAMEIYRNWVSRDPAAAQTWLDQLDLDDTFKDYIRGTGTGGASGG